MLPPNILSLWISPFLVDRKLNTYQGCRAVIAFIAFVMTEGGTVSLVTTGGFLPPLPPLLSHNAIDRDLLYLC